MCSPQRDLVNTTACEHHEWPRINSSYECSNTQNNTYMLSALTAALWSGLTLKIVLYFLWLYRFFPPLLQFLAVLPQWTTSWATDHRGNDFKLINLARDCTRKAQQFSQRLGEREKKNPEETKRKPKEHHTMKDSKRTGRATCVAAAAASSIAGKRLTSGHRSQHGTSQTVKLCGATAIASQGGGRQPRNDSITATMTTNDML